MCVMSLIKTMLFGLDMKIIKLQRPYVVANDQDIHVLPDLPSCFGHFENRELGKEWELIIRISNSPYLGMPYISRYSSLVSSNPFLTSPLPPRNV